MTTVTRHRTRPVRDTLTMMRRNLLRSIRRPQILMFSIVQPIMFVLLFRFVFGGAIRVPGMDYVDYLIPGIMVQTALFAGVGTAVGLADDLSAGAIDRFRSLPMMPSAVLSGRTASDAIRNTAVLTVVLTIGTVVGFRFNNGVAGAIGAVVLVMLFSYSFSWMFASIALFVREPEAVQSATFLPLFPLIFAASTFAPTFTMPGWLEAFADYQPVSVTVDSVRAMAQGGELAGPMIKSLFWCFTMLAIFVPLAVWQFKRT